MTEPLQETEYSEPHPDDARKLPARPPTFGRFIILGAVAAIAGTVVIVAWLNQPAMRSYPAAAAFDLSECAYEQTANSASEAEDRYHKPASPLSKTASARALHEAEAAQQKEERARVCEERKRQDSDLSAQWHSAVAAENTARFTAAGYWWGVVELVFLFMALGAACWAALEGKRAADAAHAQHVHARQESLRERRRLFNQGLKDKAASVVAAQRRATETDIQKTRFEQQLDAANKAAANTLIVGQAQTRAYLSVEAFHLKWLKTGIELQVHLMNTGQSPAQKIRCGFASCEFWFETDAGIEKLSCSLGRNMFVTASDIQANKPGVARCNFGVTMGADLTERFIERAARYKYSAMAEVIVLWDDVFDESFEIPVRGQRQVKSVTGDVRLDVIGGPPESAKPFILKNCDDRTQWGGLLVREVPPMPAKLRPIPPEPEPPERERI